MKFPKITDFAGLRPIAKPLMVAVSLVASSGVAFSANGAWRGNAKTAFWNELENWNGQIPGSGIAINSIDIATFENQVNRTVLLHSNWNVGRIYINATGAAGDAGANDYTFANVEGNSYGLSLSSQASVDSFSIQMIRSTLRINTHTFNVPLILEGATETSNGIHRFTNLNGSNVIYNGSISGGVTTGSVALRISGEVNAPRIFNGEIGDGAAGGGVSVWLDGLGVTQLNAANSFSGGFLMTAGSLELNADGALGTGTVTLQGGTLIRTNNRTISNQIILNGSYSIENSSNLLLAGNVSLGDLQGEFRTLAINTGATRFEGVISDGAVSMGINFQRSSSSAEITFARANTFTGGVKLGVGTLILEDDHALGTGKLVLNGTTAATGILRAAGRAIANDMVWDAYANFGGGAVTMEGNISLGNEAGEFRHVTVANGWNVRLSGVISDGASATGVSKGGAGTLTLIGDNTYTGTTTVTAGSLTVGDGGMTGRLGTGAVVVNAGNLTINRAGTYLAGNDISGNGGLVKQGTGIVILVGENSYIGTTTVSAGMLLVDGLHEARGAYSIASGATLGGTGEIVSDGGMVTFDAGAKLAPGGLSGGGALKISLSSHALDLTPVIGGNATGGLIFQLGHSDASSSLVLSSEEIVFEQVNIGVELLNFDDFSFILGAGFRGGKFVLIDTWYGISGTLGKTLSGEINGLAASIYFGEDGNENRLVLTVAAPIPEPGVAALLMAGVGFFCLHGRRGRVEMTGRLI